MSPEEELKKARINRAQLVLTQYIQAVREFSNCEDYQYIEDLITDLLHLAKSKGADPDRVIEVAVNNFDFEFYNAEFGASLTREISREGS